MSWRINQKQILHGTYFVIFSTVNIKHERVVLVELELRMIVFEDEEKYAT